MIVAILQLSNITDRAYLGPTATLFTFGPLLKRKAENPNATIVALFLNAVHEVFNPQDYRSSARSAMDRLRSYIPVTRDMVQDGSMSNPGFIKLMSAQGLLWDFDELFSRFIRDCRLDEIGQATGLKMKSKNTIVQPWPMRIKRNATQSEFDVLLASGHNGSERYVEWESVA